MNVIVIKVIFIYFNVPKLPQHYQYILVLSKVIYQGCHCLQRPFFFFSVEPCSCSQMDLDISAMTNI